MTTQKNITQSTNSSTLADILERILDKGIVITGDIKVKIVDIELLTIQIRLVICSVDKAKEIGIDWWVDDPAFSRNQPAASTEPGNLPEASTEPDSMATFAERLARLEAVAATPPDGAGGS